MPSFNAKKIVQSYYQKPEKFWVQTQQRENLRLFSEMNRYIPAYKKFLKQNGYLTSRKAADWAKIPSTNKANYFHLNSLESVSWVGNIKKTGLVLTSTSGSTGNPTYFARSEQVDLQYSALAEFFLQNGPSGSTLLLDCFGMGVWIGGLITYQAFRYAALSGWPVTILTPGINKKEIFHALRELAPQFKNVILSGYPPFIKDILDEARLEKIDVSSIRIRLLFAAESFTESFRDYVAKQAGIKDLLHDTLNIYGSAELGAMAFETPLSILIRRTAIQNPNLYEKLFGKNRIPTLAQYNPQFVSFTEENGEVLITANSSAPFMKYKIGDSGGVYGLGEIEKIFKDQGFNLRSLAAKAKVKITTLPLVYVYERSDLSTKLYGAIIYPQHIKEALYHPRLAKSVTGKFHATTRTDTDQDQFLEINIELKRGTAPTPQLLDECLGIITDYLVQNNAEYKNNYNSIPARVTPKIKLWPHEHPDFFKPGIKQTWIKK